MIGDISFNSLTVLGHNNDDNIQGEASKLTFRMENGKFKVKEARFTNTYLSLSGVNVTGDIKMGNNSLCYLYLSIIEDSISISGNNNLNLWKSYVANLKSEGTSASSMIPSSPFDKVGKLFDDVDIGSAQVSLPASVFDMRFASWTVTSFYNLTSIKGYQCRLVVSGTVHVLGSIDLGVNGIWTFEKFLSTGGRLVPFRDDHIWSTIPTWQWTPRVWKHHDQQ
ncbi:hypothetical protein SAMD00019534_079420 [Acytostelium subglobosum LB1]|uniref:hypothetical protein n=1 Tax=Acytostelium subglobosum LB1 TaxID=1410327 RepID=UPI000644BFB2|nr:hypothetical protein SAMD00019534_079420 [Acytostelium subglobosum LB1]GAM24767.1 hypothetical protein SAMD00019534_079420 [Acytostelium subglobosum LB1]|eukprot:XP_012752436.1 hypothetical protein SAMD00019534_079420 [Acytostelium subglobosum LB1]